MNRFWAFCTATFLGAFLLFQLELMVAKSLLPAFGGSYLVWGACMVFFQGMLLAGYAWAHYSQKWLGVRLYSRLHWLLLLAAVFVLPLKLGGFDVDANSNLVGQVVRILLLVIGLPFFVLSATSVLMQKWLASSELAEGCNPYMLYGASNLGSILALISYPLLVEPFLPLAMQTQLWWCAFIGLVLLHFFCMPRKAALTKQAPQTTDVGTKSSTRGLLACFLLSASGCAALLATTNVMTFDMAAVPLLWVLPLIVYLLTFVLVFKRKPWLPAWTKRAYVFSILAGITLYLILLFRLQLPIWCSILFYLGVLFIICLTCHIRLYELRPNNNHELTRFYLVISAGGFVGGSIVSWLIPQISSSLIEYPGMFCLSAFALALTDRSVIRRGSPAEEAENPLKVPALLCGIGIILIATLLLPWLLGTRINIMPERVLYLIVAAPVALALLRFSRSHIQLAALLLTFSLASQWTEGLAVGAQNITRLRNYYGIYRIYDKDNQRYLQHGTTLHGRQYLDPQKKSIPLSYFHPDAPAGALLSSGHPFERIGMVGLGSGALVAYAGEGQEVVIYELDPDNIPIALEHFSYIAQAQEAGAEVNFVIGDGRISLRKEGANSFDLLILDAFASGSVPVHLLTLEAFDDYMRVLKRDGILLLHVSNEMLYLESVVRSAANSINAFACSKSFSHVDNPDADDTVWMVVSRDRNKIDFLLNELGWIKEHAGGSLATPWTDQYSNLLSVLRKR